MIGSMNLPLAQPVVPLRDRDSPAPLLICAAVAIVLHVAVLAMFLTQVVAVIPSQRSERPSAVIVPPPPPQDDEVTIGREDSVVSSVAWIDHADFHDLLARRSRTLQPALQQMVDPVEEAPIELDATPPAPVAVAEVAPPTPPQPEVPAEQLRPPAGAIAARVPLPLPELDTPAETPLARRIAPVEPGEREPDHVVTPPTPEPVAPSPPTPASASEARPTAAARSDREAPPTTVLEDSFRVVPGRVEARHGLEIQTVAPRFSIPARFTAPRNPVAEVVFNRHGEVVDARLTRSTGYENVDGPILASLYRWRAKGERIEQMQGTLTITVNILLQ
jgi:outer membrane biosynthesis protein TonB